MKRIIYTLVGMMLCVGAWAQTSLQEQINNAEAGATVTLTENVTLTDRIDINKNITVDLGNHTITTTATCGNGSAFNIVSGTVTIQNGTIDASFGEANSGETDAITARSGSDVTLKDLNITVKSKNGACAYAFEGSKITIKSGHYENQTTEPYQYNANITAMVVNQGNVATQLIFIEGGTFKGYDPTLGDDSQTANENATFLAEGVALQKDASGNYTTTTAVAKIGGKNYATIKDAITAATEGVTIKMLADAEENVTVPAGKNIILDLNGKTLNGKKTASTPTIKNQGTLTLKNGNVRRTGEGSASWYVIENEGTITMDEGLNVEGSASSSLIRNNAAAALMTFNEGTYTQTGAFIVVKNDLGKVVVNGGTFSTASDKNVLNNWDQMTINGGTFTGNIFNGAYDTDNNTLTINNGTFNTNQIRTYLGNGQTTSPIVIKGGTFTNTNMKYVGTNNTESDENIQVEVSGGTFANEVPAKYCAEGFFPVKNDDGTYSVQNGGNGLQQMINSTTDGSVIKLTQDYTGDFVVPAGSNVVIDLNGHKITNAEGDTFTVALGGELKITGEGTVDNVTNGKAAIFNNGNCTLDGGIYDRSEEKGVKGNSNGNSWYTILNHGNMTINSPAVVQTAGGDNTTYGKQASLVENGYDKISSTDPRVGHVIDVNAAEPSLTINGGTFKGGLNIIKNDAAGIVEINDGNFSGSANYGVQNWNAMTINGGTFEDASTCRIRNEYITTYDASNPNLTINGGTMGLVNPGANCTITAGEIGSITAGEKNTTSNITITQAAGKTIEVKRTFTASVGTTVVINSGKFAGITASSADTKVTINDGEIEALKITNASTTVAVNGGKIGSFEVTKNNGNITIAESVTLGNVKVYTYNILLDGTPTIGNYLPASCKHFVAATAKYTRDMTGNSYHFGTVCVPFNLKSNSSLKFYTISGITNEALTLTEVEDVDPKTPVVFWRSNNTGTTLSVSTTDANVDLTELTHGTGTLELIGTFEDQTITDGLGSIYFINGDAFHQAKASLKVPAYRAYINYAGSANGAKPGILNINVADSDNDIDGIAGVTVDDLNTAEAIYDTNGSKLPAPQRGINIMKLANGKTVKLIIK